MDKQTLSNYGWIVIAVLVLVVMIALATPFGTFVSEAVQSTTKGLFDVNKSALDAAGVPGLTVQDQEFDVPDMNGGAEEVQETTFTFAVEGSNGATGRVYYLSAEIDTEAGFTNGYMWDSFVRDNSDFALDANGYVYFAKQGSYYGHYIEYESGDKVPCPDNIYLNQVYVIGSQVVE